MDRLPGKFVWYEHQSPDLGAARRFYESLFGWHVESMPMGGERYSMILAGDAGIGGLTPLAQGATACWRSYVSVADVNASYRFAVTAGATGVQAPFDYGDVGRSAVVEDPTGALLALWTGSRADPPDPAQAPPGHFCWTELSTPDPRRALAFYEQLLGYGHETMALPQGDYHLLTRGGVQRAGLAAAAAGAPAMWLPYVAVASAEATLARAESLGATSRMPLHDVPDVGRMGLFDDPQGATLAFIQLLPRTA